MKPIRILVNHFNQEIVPVIFKGLMEDKKGQAVIDISEFDPKFDRIISIKWPFWKKFKILFIGKE